MNITEECPYCRREVELTDKFKLQECPKCQSPIMPCSICEERPCDKCPLETEEYREKLINKCMQVLYGTDDPKYDSSNRTYLNSLTNVQLSIKLECELDAIANLSE